jgi:hypothetical protein
MFIALLRRHQSLRLAVPTTAGIADNTKPHAISRATDGQAISPPISETPHFVAFMPQLDL